MKRKTIWIISIASVFLLLIGLTTGFFIRPAIIGSNDASYPLKIIGDVEELQTINSINNLIGIERIENKDKILEAIRLGELIATSKPFSDSNKILFVGNDGAAAMIDGTDIEKSFITYSVKNGWEVVNLNHPVSSNIKNISEIVISSMNNSWDYGLNIINPGKNLINITPGQMYLKADNVFNYEGTPSMDKDNKIFKTDVYKLKKEMTIADLLMGSNINSSDLIADDSRILVMGQNGEFEYLENDGYFEMKDNYINYWYSNGNNSIEKIAGVMLEPPAASIMDSYYDSLHFIEKNEKVLLVYIDGFSYQQYLKATGSGFAPFLESVAKADVAASIYEPVTNAGFAAMITGKAPVENGIYSRKQRELRVQSIFGKIQDMGKTALLIEGDIQIIKTETEPMLHVDGNSDGMKDDEIFESAFKNTQEGYDFLMVHFHNVDEKGHDFGDMSEKTMEAIRQIDEYISLLAKNWHGEIIISSDHGMHSVGDEGSHGDFRFEDLIVPYLIIEGYR